MPRNELDAIAWLSGREPSFGLLPDEERDALMQFALIWTYFESHVCGRDANLERLEAIARKWKDKGAITDTTFRTQFEYYRDRYFQAGALTSRFDSLRMPSSRRQFLEDVLAGRLVAADDIAAALLLIVYRLRNNLFHGEKWSYNLANQLDNFTHAIAILKTAIELHEGCR